MRASSGISIVTAAVGAALTAYFLDRDQGRRRRALVRDKLHSGLSRLDDAASVTAVDLGNRVQGTFAALRRRFRSRNVADDVLTERVRSRLGRVVSHPGSITVAASQGTLTLHGPILKREMQRALRAAWAVPGVHNVVNQLIPYKQAEDVSGLQGGSARNERLDMAQRNWSPATRFLAGTGGASMLLYGLSRRSFASPLVALAGVGLLTRAATNMETKRLLGWRGRRGVDFTKTLHIDAPVDEVFGFWSNFEKFPKFMRNVRTVNKNRDNSWHWEVAGPLGTTVRWDAQITQYIPREVIAWATEPGGSVQHSGIVRFQEDRGGTRLHIRMSYSPAGGALGHVVASLFGADPLSEIDEDLMRLKAYFESGRPARDAAQAHGGPRPAA